MVQFRHISLRFIVCFNVRLRQTIVKGHHRYCPLKECCVSNAFITGGSRWSRLLARNQIFVYHRIIKIQEWTIFLQGSKSHNTLGWIVISARIPLIVLNLSRFLRVLGQQDGHLLQFINELSQRRRSFLVLTAFFSHMIGQITPRIM